MGGGKAYWLHGTSKERGVAILLRKKGDCEVLKSFHDSEGCITGITFKLATDQFTLLNIYAPNNDDPNFWIQVLQFFEQYLGKRILVGDFNLALDVDTDRSSPNAKNNDRSAEIVNTYMEDTMMSDVWRDCNPELTQYTYFRRKPYFIGSRLEYILVDTVICAWCTEVKILPGFRTDHSAVHVSLDPHGIHRGKGLWKMNTRVLYEKQYLDMINHQIMQVGSLTTYQTTPDRWEALKLQIIGSMQQDCNERASQ